MELRRVKSISDCAPVDFVPVNPFLLPGALSMTSSSFLSCLWRLDNVSPLSLARLR